MRKTIDSIQATAVAIALFVAIGSVTAEEHLGLVINEDNSHFYFTRAPDDLTLAGLHAFVDQYANTGVSHLFLCPNAMKASFGSKSRDAIWELGNQDPPTGKAKTWVSNARTLHERGLDPYAVWIARCRKKRISPWLSMRMNDVHDTSDPKSYQHSTFWVEHPEYRRIPAGATGWRDHALNYGIAEVREHAMSFIRELLERYDPDGIELDWMRFGYHFKPGEEENGREILTEFMRQVRELANVKSRQRGHPIKVGARVPTHPDAAAGLGMDGVTWAREGLVDMLVPTPFYHTSDFDIPIELWRQRIGQAAAKVVLAAGLEHYLQAGRSLKRMRNDLPSFRGFVAASLHRGADQIYLFNFMDSDTRPVSTDDYRRLLAEGANIETAINNLRRHVLCYRDTVPPGFPDDMVLPAERKVKFKLYTGSKPAKARVTFILGLAERDGLETASFALRMNGVPCQAIDDMENPSQFPSVTRAVRFDCPPARVKAGYNEFFVQQHEGQPDQRLVWAEVRVEP